MAKELDETLEFPFGSGGQSGMVDSATRMRRTRTCDIRKATMKLTVFAPTGSTGEQFVRPATR